MKYDIINNVNIEDIEAYSVPAADENMRNVANLINAGIRESRKSNAGISGKKLLRAALAAAVTVVMTFSLFMAASAEFREAVAAFFAPLNTEEVTDGLEKDSFYIFMEELGKNQYISIEDGIITVESANIERYWQNLEPKLPIAMYEYNDGIIQKIDTITVDTTVSYRSSPWAPFEIKDCPVYFIYGIRANGELAMRAANYYEPPGPGVKWLGWTTAEIPGRTDAVFLDLRETSSERYMSHMFAVEFNLETFETTQGEVREGFVRNIPLLYRETESSYTMKDYIEAYEKGETLYTTPTGKLIDSRTGGYYEGEIDEYFGLGFFSPNGEWLAYYTWIHEERRSGGKAYLLNMYTGEKYDFSENFAGENLNFQLDWLEDDVLAVMAYSETWLDEETKSLYVFRIDERFLSAR